MIFDILRQIRLRPSMHIGGESPYGREALMTLSLLLHGYRLALLTHEIEEPGTDFHQRFKKYLHDVHAMPMSPLGFVGMLSEGLAPTEDIWSEFWRLVDEYEEYLATPQAPS